MMTHTLGNLMRAWFDTAGVLRWQQRKIREVISKMISQTLCKAWLAWADKMCCRDSRGDALRRMALQRIVSAIRRSFDSWQYSVRGLVVLRNAMHKLQQRLSRISVSRPWRCWLRLVMIARESAGDLESCSAHLVGLTKHRRLTNMFQDWRHIAVHARAGTAYAMFKWLRLTRNPCPATLTSACTPARVWCHWSFVARRKNRLHCAAVQV